LVLQLSTPHIIQRSHSATIKFPNFIEKFGTADKHVVAAPNVFLSPDNYRDRRRQAADSHAALPTFADAKCWHCRSCRSKPAVSYANPLAPIMKKNLALIIIFFASISIFAQNTFDKKPEINGTVWDFSLTPNGTLWLCSDYAQVLSFNPNTNKWTSWDTKKPIRGYKNIRFFNDEIGIIYGFLKKDNSDFLLRTEDGGKSWSEINLPDGTSSMWINSSILNSDGSGIIGSTYYIFKTTDFGQTWKTISEVPREGADESPCEILMTEKKVFFVSCQLNTLKTANSDFSEIKNANMPSDKNLVKLEDLGNAGQQSAQVQIDSEGKMVIADISSEIDSKVENITQLENDLFVLQGGKIFYTDKDILDWKPLNEQNFIKITSNNKSVFAIDENFKVYEIDNQKNIKLFNKKKIAFHPWKFRANEKGLFILDFTSNQIGIITKENIIYE
jgi:hypothetical protein